MTSDKPWFVEGLKRYRAGEPLQWSTDISEDPSWGYGMLDDNGFFQHSVPYEDLSEHDKATVAAAIGTRRKVER